MAIEAEMPGIAPPMMPQTRPPIAAGTSGVVTIKYSACWNWLSVAPRPVLEKQPLRLPHAEYDVEQRVEERRTSRRHNNHAPIRVHALIQHHGEQQQKYRRRVTEILGGRNVKTADGEHARSARPVGLRIAGWS